MRNRMILLASLFGVAGCDDGGSNATSLLKISETVVDTAQTTVILYAEDSLATGYNSIVVELRDASGGLVDDADVTLLPMMVMTDMSHSCPIDTPAMESGRWRGGITFQMASTDMDHWHIDVQFMNHANGMDGTARFPVEVKTSNRLKMATVDSTSYILALRNPVHPVVGMNELEIAMYRRESMMRFPPVTNGFMTFEPTMPSMGHGSPNNVNPHHHADGFYHGEVNFTMTGDWQLAVRTIVGLDTVNVTYDVVVE